MLPTRVLRTSVEHALKQYIANPVSRQQWPALFTHNYRPLCSPQPVQKHSPSASPASQSKIEHVNRDKLHNGDPSKAPDPIKPDTNPTGKSSPATETATQQKEKIPDVPSTSWSSIGFEEQDAKDPNKWKKFAWKYAGAVLLFMISYKTLHWYTDRLEEDGKRRRKEMEEDREVAEQILSSSPPSAQSFPFLEPLKDAPQLPKATSELDELYIYKAELEEKLQDLRSQSRSSEVRALTSETQAELKDLADEIKLLETKRAGS